MTSLTDLEIHAMRAGLDRREFSAEELTGAHLARIEALDGGLNAFLHVARDGAFAAARAWDRDRRPQGPLAGIPVALKDILCTRDMPTTCGSALLEGYLPPYEATLVTRLREAGAILLGKTNLDEFAMGSSCENSAFGPTRNPFALDRVPGGSSGGSAAAVAARLAAGAYGTDTGGSIRQPAALCGVVGFKPSYGRVSRHGLVAFASSLDQAGPLARSVRDVAALVAAVWGPDPRDATCAPEPPPTLEAGADPSRLTFGLPKEMLGEGVEKGVEDAVRAALNRLTAAGARIEEISLPHTEAAIPTYYLIAMAEASANLARYDGVRFGRRVEGADLDALYAATRSRGLGAEVKRRILLGTFVLSAGYYDAFYVRAQKVRTLIREDFRRAFTRVDLVVTPTSPGVAFRLGERTDDPLAMYRADIFTVPASLAGLPAISIPCGASAGLPVGLQIIGRAFADAPLLAAARQVEAALALPPFRPSGD